MVCDRYIKYYPLLFIELIIALRHTYCSTLSLNYIFNVLNQKHFKLLNTLFRMIEINIK